MATVQTVTLFTVVTMVTTRIMPAIILARDMVSTLATRVQQLTQYDGFHDSVGNKVGGSRMVGNGD